MRDRALIGAPDHVGRVAGGFGTALLTRYGVRFDPDRGDGSGGTATLTPEQRYANDPVVVRAQRRIAAAEARELAAISAVDELADDAPIEAVEAAGEEFSAAGEDLERARVALERAVAMAAARERLVEQPSSRHATPANPDGAERTYHPGAAYSFLRDAYSASKGDVRAAERIARSNEQEIALEVQRRGRAGGEQLRDLTSTSFGALIPTVYLTDEVAELARAGRPFANRVRRLPLPSEGNAFIIPRLTTGTAVAVQASENAAVQETDAAVTDLTINVRTIAGQQDLSRQSVERGGGMDDLIVGDLTAAFSTYVEGQALTGSGAGGQLLGVLNTANINAVTYTDASPTLGELHPKILSALAQVATNRLAGVADALWMTPTRWAWMNAVLDASGRPFLTAIVNGPQNALGVSDGIDQGVRVGSYHGVPVYTNPMLPSNLGAGTNEDVIVAARMSDIILWEENGGMPRALRFEEPGASTLTVKVVVYGYAMFTAARYPKAVSVISGTGMIVPTL